MLAFCIFEKARYTAEVCPAVQALKYRHFGHDAIVLHTRDITRAERGFSSLRNPGKQEAFINEVCSLVDAIPFTVVAVVIRKDQHVKRYSSPGNPYELAMEWGLERVALELARRGQEGRLTHVVCECRGKKEDRELEAEFRRVMESNPKCQPTPMAIVMCDKRGNDVGLQIADLIAAPIGAKVLHPTRQQRAYDIIRRKFRTSPGGGCIGWGLKVFPAGDLTGL